MTLYPFVIDSDDPWFKTLSVNYNSTCLANSFTTIEQHQNTGYLSYGGCTL